MMLQGWATAPLTVLAIVDAADGAALAALLPPDNDQGITLHALPSAEAARHLDPTIQLHATILGGADPLALLPALAGTAAGDAPAVALVDRADRPTLQTALAAGAVDALARRDLSAPLLSRAVRYAAASRAAERTLAQLELFDEATGLPRQTLFWEILAGAVKRAARDDSHPAVMLLELANLPRALPGEALPAADIARRDRVLAEIGHRLAATLRARDTVARFDAYLLALVVEGLPSLVDIQGVAERVIEHATAPVDLPDGPLTPQAALGIALYPTAGLNAEGLISAAARALTQAQAHGPNRYHFD